MKKTLLATAIAGAMAASGAQAATVYSQDGTELIVNGRIALGIEGGGPTDEGIDNGARFRNVGSRLGLSLSQDISRDLRAFGRVEWRFNADERDQESGFDELRHSYIGLESASWGTVQAGNYDSFYNTYIMGPFDVYIQDGYEFAQDYAEGYGSIGGGYQARGDSIGYITPNLSGFQAYLSAKHYSQRNQAETSADSEITTQGGVSYETGPLRLALGYVDNEGGRAEGTGEMLYGASAVYAFNDAFSARLGYETMDEDDDGLYGYDAWGLGGSYAMGQWAFAADVYRTSYDDARENRTSWVAGVYYDLTSNFDVFVEATQRDQGSITIDPNPPGDDNYIETGSDDVYWITGARYHF
ncbi:porin [Litchfieldella xinjiangensis]|uniref:porin n=1 Tax=Litchfieldella xinjiangensis TaxID=1166948 RepID=UPI0005BD5229|nr:porin [Halomonas xinjiangensis]